MEKTISVAIVDCGESPNMGEALVNYLKKIYPVKLVDPQDADYVIHSVGGHDVLRYPGIRIFLTGELLSADYNISDYSLTFDRLQFGDRHLWFPLIKLYTEAYSSLIKPRRAFDEILLEKSAFCAYVMSNTKNSANERQRIFDVLNNYKAVNCGGKWNNNVGGRVADKHAFQRKHKFVIAFENHSSPGYLTEKFAEAAMVDAIPIYWGDPEIGNYFNTKAFINCHEFVSFDAVLERVKEIDSDDLLYREMLQQPWFYSGHEPECFSDETVTKFLMNIFDQPREQAFRRNFSRWGKKHEQRLKRMWEQPFSHLIRRKYKQFRLLCKKGIKK